MKPDTSGCPTTATDVHACGEEERPANVAGCIPAASRGANDDCTAQHGICACTADAADEEGQHDAPHTGRTPAVSTAITARAINDALKRFGVRLVCDAFNVCWLRLQM
jgi:hypothetical protein